MYRRLKTLDIFGVMIGSSDVQLWDSLVSEPDTHSGSLTNAPSVSYSWQAGAEGRRGTTMRAALDAIRTLVYASGFALFWGWIALRVRPYDNNLGITLPDWARGFGIPLMLLGGIVALTCAGTFVVVGQGTPAPFDAPRRFVAVGPYKYVRNPMYIGALIVLFGFGLYLRSLSVLVLPFGVLLLAHLFVILYEEPNLRNRFGLSYEDYCRHVNRWIPRLPPAKSKHETENNQ